VFLNEKHRPFRFLEVPTIYQSLIKNPRTVRRLRFEICAQQLTPSGQQRASINGGPPGPNFEVNLCFFE